MGSISFGFGYQFLSFYPQKRLKNEFHDPEIVTADDKNAIETPFLAVLNPQKGMGGKVKFFGLNWIKKSAEIAIFVQGGFKSPPPSTEISSSKSNDTEVKKIDFSFS